MADENNPRQKLQEFGGKAIAKPLPAEDANSGRTVSAFKSVLDARKDELVALLPKHVTFERLRSTALEAVRQNPQLLYCEPRSLLGAVSKAANDGLLPDGRDGVITAYKDKRSGKLIAAWNPMANGLRKRARELDGIIVDADVVHANDHWKFTQGDRPSIEHERPPLGEERGQIVGAYAIFRQGDHILHREVMDATEIAKARAQSRAPDSLMWSTFAGEGAKKVVVRRGFKTVQCSEPLDQIIRRDEELFDLSPAPSATVDIAAGDVQQIEQPTGDEGGKEIEGKAEEVPEAKPKRKRAASKKASDAQRSPRKAETKKKAPAKPKATKSALDDDAAPQRDFAAEGKRIRTALWKAKDIADLDRIWEAEVEPREAWPADELRAVVRTYNEQLTKRGGDVRR